MIKIVTHNAKFHADDVFATASLFILLGKDKCEVIRTRDEALISSADYVVDVGNVYDEGKNLFDHHQREGAGARENSIPYASFGLVWKKFGKEICGSEATALEIDRTIVQPIDATDNGVDISKPLIDEVYQFDLYSLVNQYRLTWKEEGNWDEKFLECVDWAMSILKRQIKITQDFGEAKLIVLEAYEKAPDKRVIVIDDKYDVGREIARSTLSKLPEPLFAVLYRKDHGNWQMVTINKKDSFEARKDVPEAWRGYSGVELEEISGVPGSIFCHRGSFMCVTETKESVIALAEKALNT
ncbi:MAG: MYG1 family protein [Parcubacteria group bacterium]